MTNNNKYLKTIGSTLIVGAFLFFAFGSDDSKSTSSSSSSSSSSSKPEEKKCVRCGGRGSISTYSSATCTMSHFDQGDCYGGHKSGFNCTPVGSKTCPCCNGSGK
jgi:hypothetical protein